MFSFNSKTKKTTGKQINNENFNKYVGKNNKNKSRNIPASITDLKGYLKKDFSLCSDFIMRECEIGTLGKKIIVAFFEGFVDKQILAQNVIDPILKYSDSAQKASAIELLKKKIISNSSLKEVKTYEESINGITFGDAVIYIDGESAALIIGVKSPEKRAVADSQSEITIKGSREGFTESLRTNIILLRRRIKNPQFKVENFKIGEETKSDVSICYIDGIVKPEIVEEVKNRISSIKVDAVLATGYIEQFIQDDKYSVFPIVGNSEKPDKVSGKLLEGRVAIIVDGTPTVLTVPYLFIEAIQVPEDYYGEYAFSSFIRMLRFISFIIAIYLPAMYVAVTAFHQTIIPYKLLLSMAASREGIPFPPFVEALLMILTFETLREAGIRQPRGIGQAVSIVGAIVLGDAAVNAGIASAPLIIVAALSGICSFIIPPLMKIESLLRIVFLIAANFLGLLGVSVMTIMLITYLCNKQSFGIPYLVPFSPLHTEDLKDTLIVVPIWRMFTRPKSLTKGQDIVRTEGRTIPDGGNKS